MYDKSTYRYLYKHMYPQGKLYYHNETTDKTRWKMPKIGTVAREETDSSEEEDGSQSISEDDEQMVDEAEEKQAADERQH
jgi:hypothetical protein